jgi:endonuclease IV
MDNSNNNQPPEDISNEEKLNRIKNSLQELFKEDERIADKMNEIIDKKQSRTKEDIEEFERLFSLSEELSKRANMLKIEWLAAIKK